MRVGCIGIRKSSRNWPRRSPSANGVKNIQSLERLAGEEEDAPPLYSGDDLRRRQVAAGYTLEELELLLQPMVETAKEAVGSMGDDTPIAVLSGGYRGLHHFFRQSFSQVTNPAIDSLREYRVMSLNTRLGNLRNILSEDEEQTRFLLLDSPVLLNSAFEAMREQMGDTAVEIDCTSGSMAENTPCVGAIYRIQRIAEDSVRGGGAHLV